MRRMLIEPDIRIGILACAVGLTITVAKPTAWGQSEVVGDGFTRHGVAAAVSRARGAAVVQDDEGKSQLAVWIQDHRGCYGLLMINPDTGETRFFALPFDIAVQDDAPFAFLYSKRGYYYSLFGNHFVEFNPRTGEYTYVEKSHDRAAMWMTEDDNGVIWAGNYPGAHIVSFDPELRRYFDYGPINVENWPQYPRGLATDAAGWVYAGIGFTNNHILAMNPASGAIKPMVEEEDRKGGNVTLWRGEDGRVYGRMPANGPWLQMYDGHVRRLTGAPDVSRAKEISNHQGGLFGKLPDGREIDRLNLPEGWLRIVDEDGGSTRVSFDYPSDGSWIYSLAVGPDGRIYGSTGHPLYFFAYDPLNDSFWNTPVSGGHVNAMISQAEKLFGAVYTGGILIEYTPNLQSTSNRPNPRVLASAGNILLRPHTMIALSDGRHVIQAGSPGYGRTGGGMMVYDLQTKTATVYDHTQLLEYHSTKALAELPDGNLIGGTSTAPGTGGERIAKQAELYIMDWPSMEIVYRQAILPNVPEIRELIVADDGLVYGLDAKGTFFVFEPNQRELIHTEALCEHYGNLTGGQAPRVWAMGKNGVIYSLFAHAVVRIEPGSFKHERLAHTPVHVNIGVALHEQRLYFTSGSSLWSYVIDELQ